VVSDFALPGWWVPNYPFQVDFLGLLPGPLQVASGGYIAYEVVELSGLQRDLGAGADLDMRGAADAMREELTAGYGSRLDVLRQLEASRGLAQTQPSARAAPIAGEPRATPIPERLLQPAVPGGDVTVVARENVPRLGST
jgi:hypothetical protein